MRLTCPHGYQLEELATGATVCERCGNVSKDAALAIGKDPRIARLERIEATAEQLRFSISESKKIGQFISTEWILQKLTDALKPVKP